MTSAQPRKIAVVTGGTAGVGRATVREFARSGYDVAVLARGQAGLDAAVREVRSAGGRGLGIPTDVADYAAGRGSRQSRGNSQNSAEGNHKPQQRPAGAGTV